MQNAPNAAAHSAFGPGRARCPQSAIESIFAQQPIAQAKTEANLTEVVSVTHPFFIPPCRIARPANGTRKMILSTHAVVGGAIASFIPSHPLLAVGAGFASHFVLDAIPHWDYSLHSIAVGKGADNRRLQLSRGVLIDLIKIGFDAAAGLALALWLFSTPASMPIVAAGACAAMLPDALQFVHSVFPREPLSTLQRVHGWIHSRRKLTWKLGVSSQIAITIAVAAATTILS
jgi:hypothetical protein